MPSIGSLDEMARQTKAPQQIAAVSVFLPLAIIAVAIRLWIRTRMIHSFGWDDIMMVVALLNFVIYDVSLMVIVGNGGGTHLRNMVQLRVAINWTLVAEVFYLTTILFLKVSLGLFFLRVVLKNWQRKVIYVTVFVSTIINIYHTIFIIFSCGNPRYYLENMLNRKCVRKNVEVGLAYEQAAVTTATDFVFALLPVPLLWNASMDTRSKLSVGFILCLGTLGSVCSIVRFKYVDGLGSHDDFFWNAANVSIWSTLEMGTGIIAGCLATMRPLFKRLMYGAVHLTHAATHRGNRTSKTRLWKGKQSESTSRSESHKSAQDWKKSVDTSTYTTTCIGGRDLEFAEALADEKGVHLVQLREEKEYPQDVWSKDPERARIWPFAAGDGINKTVNVQVSVSEEQPFGGGLWGQRVEDVIQAPKKTRKGSRDDDSIPEWDKLPDLILPSRPGTRGSNRSRSRSRSPPLIRVSSK